MPFTAAHPAIILPLINRKVFSATGLIVGSISPDFEYFFKARVSGIYGHNIAGIFYFDLPVCFLIAFLFHELIKESFVSNLPASLQRRLSAVRSLDFKSYFKSKYHIFILSSLLGAGSHVLWDSFTHNGTYFVQNFSFYHGSYIPFQGVKYPLWYALQHISTVTGLTLVVMYVIFMPADKATVVTSPKLSYWVSLFVLGGLFFVLRFSLFQVRFDLGNAVVTSISSTLLSVCLLSPVQYFKPSSN